MIGLSPHAEKLLEDMPLISKNKLGLVKVKTICIGVNIIEDFYKIMKDNDMQITAVVNIALEEYLTKLGLYRKK